jgi:cardiolipin synthase
MDAKDKEDLYTLPNLLTLLRICLIPVFIVMVFRKQGFGALFIFFLAGLTDVLDGFTARMWHLKTKIGMLIDPIADKLLLSTAFILLTFKDMDLPYMIPLWLTVTVVSRDLLMILGGVIIYLWKGEKNFPPSTFGKISTVLQVGTVFLVLLANYVLSSSWSRFSLLSSLTSPSFLSAFFVLTLASTLVSGTHYVLRGIRMTFFTPNVGG